ncbi:hypothetical protein CERZMDRAFT_99811 [Cercospora zeae-maydis SCOH1-5]|uniref:Aminoglycoside phosphotransferase domain-containing protein n=1 Tax=Cercospora zeae-maydis SCOH1-5 TaxID=717836 RepID=A0A6A6F9P4_9PEZI|nr:hypothetical protein CERZMDRAFT_99811 [Cercospora zeae-maydis SCOH1-5]
MGSIAVSTEVIEQPPSWQKSVHEYLAENDLKCQKATPLQGGASAYIWKLEGLAGQESCSRPKSHLRSVSQACIMKYGDETAKSVAEIKMSPDRMSSEARAMNSKVLAQVCAEEPSVEIPRLVGSTDQAVIMSWAGETDLRSAYIKDQNLDARDAGSRIGRWAAIMHRAGRGNPEVENWACSTRDSVLKLEEDHLRTRLSGDPNFTPEDVERAAAAFHAPDDVHTLSPYDFRPMNTLLRPGQDASRPRITVVDWEITGYGDPAFDLRMWVAEAIATEAKHGGERGLLEGFLTAYRQQAGDSIADTAFVCRVAILVGSIWEFLMPCSLWDCTEADGEHYRKAGREYIRAGIDADRNWLSKSSLAPLLK